MNAKTLAAIAAAGLVAIWLTRRRIVPTSGQGPFWGNPAFGVPEFESSTAREGPFIWV